MKDPGPQQQRTHEADRSAFPTATASPSRGHAPHPMRGITELHRAIGNQAVGRLLQRKLVVNTPGDAYEQEADRVADAVMRATPASPSPALSRAAPTPRALQRACSCGGTCDDCRKEQAVQRKEGSSIGIAGAGTAAPPIVHDVLRSPGRPLDAGTRAFMEPRFGRSFADVRIHADARAAKSARSVQSIAYTVGKDIALDSGRYVPHSPQGRRLLAHELAHVVQQSGSDPLRQRPTGHEPARPGTDASIDRTPSVRLSAATSLQRVEQETDTETDQFDVEPEDTFDTLLSRAPLSYHSAKTNKTAKPRNKKPKPEDRVPTATTPSEKALKAIEHARKLKDQEEPAIWFDSWGNDLRDNNLNGKIDDKSEQGIADGTHYKKVFDAKICKDSSDTTDSCPASDQSMIKVQYKVCIDVPIESYKAAGANVSTSRWIPTFFGELKTKPNWTVWKAPAKPAQLLDGDIVAAANAAHQHAGIVDTGIINSVINLPGPTSARKFLLFHPSGTNDMKSVPRVLFESFLAIDWIAQLNK